MASGPLYMLPLCRGIALAAGPRGLRCEVSTEPTPLRTFFVESPGISGCHFGRPVRGAVSLGHGVLFFLASIRATMALTSATISALALRNLRDCFATFPGAFAARSSRFLM